MPLPPTVDQAMLEMQCDFVALQKALVCLELVLNAGKTKYMLFSNSHKKVSDGLHIYSLYGSSIDQVPSYKYLSIWIDKDLKQKYIYTAQKNKGNTKITHP